MAPPTWSSTSLLNDIGWMGILARRSLSGGNRPTYIIEGTLTSFLKWTAKPLREAVGYADPAKHCLSALDLSKISLQQDCSGLLDMGRQANGRGRLARPCAAPMPRHGASAMAFRAAARSTWAKRRGAVNGQPGAQARQVPPVFGAIALVSCATRAETRWQSTGWT